MAFMLTGCWNAPAYLVPPPIPEPEDVVGAWVNADDGGRIDFYADGSCRITAVPTGALWLDSAKVDGTPTGHPIDSDECEWQVEEDRPAISLRLLTLRSTTIAVTDYDGTEIGFYLGDPDQSDLYLLHKEHE